MTRHTMKMARGAKPPGRRLKRLSKDKYSFGEFDVVRVDGTWTSSNGVTHSGMRLVQVIRILKGLPS